MIIYTHTQQRESRIINEFCQKPETVCECDKQGQTNELNPDDDIRTLNNEEQITETEDILKKQLGDDTINLDNLTTNLPAYRQGLNWPKKYYKWRPKYLKRSRLCPHNWLSGLN